MSSRTTTDPVLPITADVVSMDGSLAMPAGSTDPPLRVQFRDARGNPVSLAGTARATALIHRDGTTTRRKASVSHASDGELTYEWSAPQTNTPGLVQVRFVVESNKGRSLVMPTGTPIGISIREEF